MSFSEAKLANQSDDMVVAADLYEAALAAGDDSLELLLNLALLYWEATDPGAAAALDLSADFFHKAAFRRVELLDQSVRMYPRSTAARFWKTYTEWPDLGRDFDVEDCRKLLREDPTVLEPALYLFSLSGDREAGAEARDLLRQCREDGTTGARYVAAVIKATVKLADWESLS